MNELMVTENHPLMLSLNDPNVIRKFEQACGRQAGSVMINIINAANMNPQIWECEPQTVITAALNVATLGLSLAPGIGQACILPFNKNRKVGSEWTTEKRAQAVIMLRGVKALAMRTNKYRVLNAFPVYKGQTWVEDQRTGIGKPEGPIQDKKNVIGYGAYLLLFNGYEATVYKTRDEITEHAKQYSPTYDKKNGSFKPGSRWLTHFDEQALKTVMKDLIMNHGEISEKDRAILEVTENPEAQSEYPDADFTEGEAKDIPQAEPEPAEVTDEEAAYIEAYEVTDFQGVQYGKKTDKDLAIIRDNAVAPKEKRQAARIILARRAAVEAKNLDQLGF
jgi:recombination protein RecT